VRLCSSPLFVSVPSALGGRVLSLSLALSHSLYVHRTGLVIEGADYTSSSLWFERCIRILIIRSSCLSSLEMGRLRPGRCTTNPSSYYYVTSLKIR
jgi:hypothetical protein